MVVIYGVLFSSCLYLVTSLTVLVTNEVMKRTIMRSRPNLHSVNSVMNLDGIFLIKKSSSMPSGDTAQSTVFAVTMIYTMNYYFSEGHMGYWWFLLTIPICGFGRIYFGKHWIGDTICGAAEGILVCLFICGTIGPATFFWTNNMLIMLHELLYVECFRNRVIFRIERCVLWWNWPSSNNEPPFCFMYLV